MKLKDSFIEFSRFGDLLLEIRRGSLKFPRTKTFVRVISHNIDEFFHDKNERLSRKKLRIDHSLYREI